MKIFFVIFFTITSTYAGPVLQMNNAFHALVELMPFLKDENKFKESGNQKLIDENLQKLKESFRLAGHDTLIKHDLFAPSYALITENIQESANAYSKGKKSYSFWMLNETVSLCMDCHGRLPQSVTSSFQNGELTVDRSKLRDPYDLGVAFMIVRRFVDAKEQFNRSIQDMLIKKEYSKLILPFQDILMIELKINKDPAAMISIINDYLKKGNLPYEVNKELTGWKKRLSLWKSTKIESESQLQVFLKTRLLPLKEKNTFDDDYKVDLLLASGLLSNYFFENQDTPSAAQLSFWLGWIEKRLKKEKFLSSGDMFLKQCIRKYPGHPIASTCLQEYKESVEFDFTGSSGTAIPDEIQSEINNLDKLVRPRKKK